jgi:hypothetical protein
MNLPDLGLYDPSSDGFDDAYMHVADGELMTPPPSRHTAGDGRTPERYEIPADAVLGRVVSEPKLNYAVLLRLAARACPEEVDLDEYRRAVTALHNPAVFRTHILSPGAGASVSDRRPVSVVPQAVFNQLRPMVTVRSDFDVVGDRPIARLYLVPKRGPDALLWRVILAVLSLNRRCRRPPRAPIPHLRELIRRVLRGDYAYRCDFRSWFYQFGLGAAVAAYWFLWALRIAGGHGLPQCCSFDRMPMGWVWSVFIACASALLLLRAGTMDAVGIDSSVLNDQSVWVDDGVLWDTDRARLMNRWAGVQKVLLEAGAELKEAEGPVRRFQMVGIVFDLVAKRWRLQQKWVDTFRAGVEAIASRCTTLRTYWRLVGCAVWAVYVLHVPYAVLEPAFVALREVAPTPPARATLRDLRQEMVVPKSAMRALVDVAAVADAWRSLPGPPRCIMPLATDASVIGRGWSFVCVEVAWPWPAPVAGGAELSERDQQRLELRTAVAAIVALDGNEVGRVPPPPRDSLLVLLVDNLGLAWRLARWQTAGEESPAVMTLWNVLCRRDWRLRVGWIRGETMPADGPSRTLVAYARSTACSFAALLDVAFFPCEEPAPSSLVIGSGR